MSEATDPEEMSVIRGMEGGFLSVAQPSGFFFVGVGPVRGTSFPFELAGAAESKRGGQFYNDNPSPSSRPRCFSIIH